VDQPHEPEIGLHGLWASETHDLEARDVPVTEWWKQGCGLYGSDDTPPVLSTPVRAGLDRVVPHLRHPLVVHEYAKHVRCFGYDPDRFFRTAMILRDRFSVAPIGQYLRSRAGLVVTHDEVLRFFALSTGATAERALQLQCGYDREGRAVLEQMWLTLRPDRLGAFPAAGAYAASPQVQDNCPAAFLVRAW